PPPPSPTLFPYTTLFRSLYFYPKDDTPGCTKEACSFRDNLARVTSKGAVILGVSRDGSKSHVKFKDKYNLNFPLLSDDDGRVTGDRKSTRLNSSHVSISY